MTRKLAVFVEGRTEQEFTIKLLTELAGRHDIQFELRKQYCGILTFVELRNSDQAELYVLVVNCTCDEQVKSQIKENYESLQGAGYSLIIGLRDVYPKDHSEIPLIEQDLTTGIPNGPVPVDIHLAILEIEAWFLEELTHYERVDAQITSKDIINRGFDYPNIRALDLPHPAETLDNIYAVVGKRYNKTKRQIQRTVDALSYEELYENTRQRAPSLGRYIDSLESWLFPPPAPAVV